MEGFVLAGTEAAYEALGPRESESPICVNCGAPLTYVFLTSVGPMGGDCLATCTGEQSTRAVFRKLVKQVPQAKAWGQATEIFVEKSSLTYGYVVGAQLITDRSYVSDGRWVNLKRFTFGFPKERELPVALAAAAYIAEDLKVPLSVAGDVPGAEEFGK